MEGHNNIVCLLKKLYTYKKNDKGPSPVILYDLSNPQDSGRINPIPTSDTNVDNIKIKSRSLLHIPFKK